MTRIRKYAAIDIGSNAIRLLITNVIEEEGKAAIFRKNTLLRMPIRLGQDVFINDMISVTTVGKMIDTMDAFKKIMKIHGVERYKACATSAMREALNGEEVAHTILDNTGVEIDIIDGEMEARIIASTDLQEYLKPHRHYLYVDVGGGSTEFSFYSLGEKRQSKSFKIGTVRLLNNKVNDEEWNAVEQWVIKKSKKYETIDLIGSGGNINKIFKLSGEKRGKPLSFLYISKFYEELNLKSMDKRIVDLRMNADRADVISYATKIYLMTMKCSGAKHIYVPKIGLSDGIVKMLHYEGTSII